MASNVIVKIVFGIWHYSALSLTLYVVRIFSTLAGNYPSSIFPTLIAAVRASASHVNQSLLYGNKELHFDS